MLKVFFIIGIAAIIIVAIVILSVITYRIIVTFTIVKLMLKDIEEFNQEENDDLLR